ncbi:hypothetical protein RMR10_004135 [Agrobacterium rosae]|uniref:hypothetical protein n=1 Tax=Agrobacterium rosae TaxID=1972867 RepID=UPI002A0FD731|nr:hypothetical protein [Agrobacterium rosae]MDX8315689.1 hypothetical protein [Agrobacterium rosae]
MRFGFYFFLFGILIPPSFGSANRRIFLRLFLLVPGSSTYASLSVLDFAITDLYSKFRLIGPKHILVRGNFMTTDMDCCEVSPIKIKRHNLLWRGIILADCLRASVSRHFFSDHLLRYTASIKMNIPHDIKGKDVILVACDEVYFWDYAISFLRSLSMIEGTFHVHLHLIKPSPDVLAQIEDLRSSLENLAVSFSVDTLMGLDLPKKVNIYYNCSRFIIADHLLDLEVGRLLILDIDTIARTSPWEKLVKMKTEGAFVFRPHARKSWHKILANAVYYKNSEDVRLFSRRFASSLLSVLARNPHYHIDQIIPHYLLKIGARRFKAVFSAIPGDLMSLGYDPASSLWTAKGGDKYGSKFQLEKSKIDNA